MDYKLAKRRGLNAKLKSEIESTHREDILFFSSTAELSDELLNHGWSISSSQDNYLCWTLKGCDIQILIDTEFDRVKLFDTDSEYKVESKVTECFMIAGSLFVGMSVEL